MGFFDIQHDSSTEGLPYDFMSIMHPSIAMFSRNHQPTHAPLRWIPPRGTGVFTEYDYLHINLVYCEGEKLCL